MPGKAWYGAEDSHLMYYRQNFSNVERVRKKAGFNDGAGWLYRTDQIG
ncbi:hypothetical protein [Prolixibacter denitrificans]|nr:hypothetical protein [Prolixibacter denitrificans]